MRYNHPVPDDSDKPATKSDLSLLRTDLRAELLATKTELRAELLATKTELREDITRLDKKIDRVATGLVNTQADVRDIRRDMATKDDIKRVLNAIDAFAKKSENNDKSVALHGHVLTEVQVELKDHEGRLKTIESARP